MFSDFFRELKHQTALGAVAALILGLVLIFAPQTMIAGVLGIVGWVLTLLGVFSLVSVFLYNRGDMGALILGVVQLLAGGWIVRHPYQLTAIAAYIVAGMVLIHAVRDIQYAVDARQAGAANWMSAAVSGGVTLLLAVLVLANPVGSAMSLISFGGVCLVIDGLSDLIMLHRLNRLF